MIVRRLFIFLFVISLPSFLMGQIQLNRFILDFPVPTAFDLDRGYIEANRGSSVPDLSVKVNKLSTSSWSLFIITEQPYFTPVNLNKPHYNLLWKLSSESESRYRPVSLQKSVVRVGRASGNVDIDFRLKLDWSDPPANYSMEVVFILEVAEKQIDSRDKKDKHIKRSSFDK